jgi:hypothetical protein
MTNDPERVPREPARLTEHLVRLPEDASEARESIETRQEELRAAAARIRDGGEPVDGRGR